MYVAFSLMYTFVLKHIPVVELAFVAAGFAPRALGGASATRVPPSGWFLVVCSLGALLVAIAKRYTELALLGPDAATHRPVMRWYTPALPRLSQRVAAGVMIAAYLLWAYGQHGGTRTLHLLSILPLAAALLRFDWLTSCQPAAPVEDLIARDRLMIVCELSWLALFAGGPASALWPGYPPRQAASRGGPAHHLGGSMPDKRGAADSPARVLLLGGTSEIGLEILAALRLPASTEVLLAGRDEQRMAAAAKELGVRARTLRFDATALDTHQALVDQAFAAGDANLVISAAGVLTGQQTLDRDPLRAGLLVETNFTAHVTTLLAAAARMRAQGHGTIVVLSSVAAIRPRKANFVYGAAKAGLDAFARGLADSLHGSGVAALLVRPGFVIGRMTAGMTPAPLATTPAAVGAAVAARLRRAGGTAPGGLIWVPSTLAPVAAAFRLLPRPLWRRAPR